MIGEPIKRSILPAQAGWQVIVPNDERCEKLHRIPVIGWLCQTYLVAHMDCGSDAFVVTTPLLCTGSLGAATTFALQYGDQPNFFADDETFETEAEVLAFFRRRERRRT